MNTTIRAGCITVYVGRAGSYKKYEVTRKPLSQRNKCDHDWRSVSYLHRGHGSWTRGCIKCGALGR